MSYKIKKNQNITEDIELIANDGAVSATLHINISPAAIAKDYRNVQIELIKAKKSADNQNEDAIEQYGKAVISMFDLLFGKENTEKILKYFENDYFEMSLQIMPFVYDVVEPALKN